WILLEHVEGKGNIVGREWLTIGPLDIGTQRERQLLMIGAPCIAGGQQRRDRSINAIDKDQRLVHQPFDSFIGAGVVRAQCLCKITTDMGPNIYRRLFSTTGATACTAATGGQNERENNQEREEQQSAFHLQARLPGKKRVGSHRKPPHNR